MLAHSVSYAHCTNKKHCPLHEISSEDQKDSVSLPTMSFQCFQETFDHFDREHLIVCQLIFCHNNWSFFLSPNICPAALFVQGEEEKSQNMDNERFALPKICDVHCLMKSNLEKIETTQASKGGRSKLSNYPHRLKRLQIFICTQPYFKLPIIACCTL